MYEVLRMLFHSAHGTEILRTLFCYPSTSTLISPLTFAALPFAFSELESIKFAWICKDYLVLLCIFPLALQILEAARGTLCKARSSASLFHLGSATRSKLRVDILFLHGPLFLFLPDNPLHTLIQTLTSTPSINPALYSILLSYLQAPSWLQESLLLEVDVSCSASPRSPGTLANRPFLQWPA